MTTLQLFRTFVILSTALYVVWFLSAGRLTGGNALLAAYSGYGAILPVHHVLYYSAWFVLWLAAAAGLLFLQDWGRRLFLSLCVLSVVLAPLHGVLVQPPMEVLLSTTSLLLDGAILALAYLTPVASAFAGAPPDGPTRAK